MMTLPQYFRKANQATKEYQVARSSTTPHASEALFLKEPS